MCGIAGFLTKGTRRVDYDVPAVMNGMLDAITHRGPDDAGMWSESDQRIALGHRRLSIIDLSAAGHQPMQSSDGRYVIVFNGEVYNFPIIRDALAKKGYAFVGHSDTEIVLAAIQEYGVKQAVKQFIGMFAFAVWDKKQQALYLVRDRLGIKPLYYGMHNQTVFFASELKAIAQHPQFKKQINRSALSHYFYLNYIPAPFSIYDGILKLLPGSMVKIDLKGSDQLPPPQRYWSLQAVAEDGVRHFVTADEDTVETELETLLKDAIGIRMMADVPLGAFLSGGVDSSLVVALMQAQSRRPVKTFSIGFSEKSYNEAHHAKAVANHLKVDHTELYVSPTEAMDVIPRLPGIYDEPFADSSQIPTFLVSQLTRQHVTVSLSGDGGDELFGGYNRYFLAQRLWQTLQKFPVCLRGIGAVLIRTCPPSMWDHLFKVLKVIAAKKCGFRLPGDKMHKLAGVLSSMSEQDLYQRLISCWRNPAVLVQGVQDDISLPFDTKLDNFVEQMMLMDTQYYLPGDILTKVDRASMAVSLEARVPLLDHRVVEYAWRLPLSMKVRHGEGKLLLRKILYRYVPQALIDRPKMGFGVPIDHWLRGPMRAWAEALLHPDRLQREGYLHVDPIQRKWKEHLSGRRNWANQLWPILMFEAWLEKSR